MASRRVGRKGESWDGWCIAVCDGIIVVVVEDLLRVLLEGESVRVPLGGRRRVDIAFRIRGVGRKDCAEKGDDVDCQPRKKLAEEPNATEEATRLSSTSTAFCAFLMPGCSSYLEFVPFIRRSKSLFLKHVFQSVRFVQLSSLESRIQSFIFKGMSDFQFAIYT